MASLPIVVGYGGISSAGRSSFHHMYNRLIIEKLPQATRLETYIDLGILMGDIEYNNGRYQNSDGLVLNESQLVSTLGQAVKNKTLIRKFHGDELDEDLSNYDSGMSLFRSSELSSHIFYRADELPGSSMGGWDKANAKQDTNNVKASRSIGRILAEHRTLKVNAAAQLPTGFDPVQWTDLTHYPRGLQMALYAASDAICSMGVSWADIQDIVSPDKISVHVSNLVGQVDPMGTGGMLRAWSKGEAISSKQLSLGSVSMPSDIVSSYVLGHLGPTVSHQGTSATFLYNLQRAVCDIQSGRSLVSIVGTSEAPIRAEVIEAVRAAGVLIDDEKLASSDKCRGKSVPNYSRSSRPFNYNHGLVLAESAQYLVLMDDALALELGCKIFGSIPSVHVNADGMKKSRDSPGVGNYITFGKSVAQAASLLGDKALRERTFVQAHGCSTPVNRRTESQVINSIANAFAISDWPVTAIKSYVGHSLACSAGDQLASTFGIWEQGWIPGIPTLDQIADDVTHENLCLFQAHKEVGIKAMDAGFINAKGFGGHNATALVLSPLVTTTLLEQRYSGNHLYEYRHRHESVKQLAEKYNEGVLKGKINSIYRSDRGGVDEDELTLSRYSVRLPGYQKPVSLAPDNIYQDMTF